MVGLLDGNNRVRDDFEASDVFNQDSSTPTIFNQVFPTYLRAVTEGVNISAFVYGSTGSGKSHTFEGSGTDTGLAHLVSENLFRLLEEKRYERQNYNFRVRIRFLEILDEEVYDLL